MKEFLRATVESGISGRARAVGWLVYGKTGTAQSTHGKSNHAWFVGYTRSSNAPHAGGSQGGNIAFCVFLEYGGSSENSVKIARDLLLKLQSLQII